MCWGKNNIQLNIKDIIMDKWTKKNEIQLPDLFKNNKMNSKRNADLEYFIYSDKYQSNN